MTTSIRRVDDIENIQDFREKLYERDQTHRHRLLDHVSPDQLKIYKSLKECKTDNFLDSSTPMSHLGWDEMHALIVQVPSPSQNVTTNKVTWSEPAKRPQLVVGAQDKIIRMWESLLKDTGVGRRNEPLVLYRRRQLIDQWNEMDRCSVKSQALLWVVGQPGTGKSSAALAFAYSVDPLWDVIWIGHSNPRKYLNCFWLRGIEKTTCNVVESVVEIPLRQLLNSTSSDRKTIVFLDGYEKSSTVGETVCQICTEWHRSDRKMHHLVCVCSMGGLAKDYRPELYDPIPTESECDEFSPEDDVEMEEGDLTNHPDEQEEKMKSRELVDEMKFELESWRFEDYTEAVLYDVFFQGVKHKFPWYDESMDASEEVTKRCRLVEAKYSLAGGSARLMFGVTADRAKEALDIAIRQVNDIESLSLDLTGDMSSSAMNRLLACYHNCRDSTIVAESETCLVSSYVARKLAIIKGPRCLQRISTLCGGNPSVDNYFFEAWFFSTLKFAGVKWTSYDLSFLQRQGEWKQSSILFFDSNKTSIDISLNGTTWLAPIQWNQGGYDAIFIDKDKKVIQFVQVTRAVHHTYDHTVFVEFLTKLAAHDDFRGVQLLQVDVYFVVPMERLLVFKRLVDSVGFRRNVVEATSLASSIAEATRSHGNLMFERCASMVRVVGVDYKMSSTIRAEGSEVM